MKKNLFMEVVEGAGRYRWQYSDGRRWFNRRLRLGRPPIHTPISTNILFSHTLAKSYHEYSSILSNN